MGGGGRERKEDHWYETDFYHSGRGGRRTINTHGGVGCGCSSNCFLLMEFLPDHTSSLLDFVKKAVVIHRGE